MNRVLAVLAFLAFGLGTALAADDMGAPVHYRAHGMTVIMHSSMKPITIILGDNPLGRPKTFTCRSAKGCVVISSASIQEDGTNLALCTFIDGVTGIPGCDFSSITHLLVVRQQMKVTQGPHTIQTILRSNNANGQVTGWEADYSIYERKVQGTD